jgi:hypothetical protein
MYTINRSLAIIRPKQPYIDWANKLSTALKITPDNLQSDCTVILIPLYDTDEEARKYIDKIAEDLFEWELFAQWTHEPDWPRNRTNEMFWNWFDVELHSEIIDFSKQAIRKTSYSE